MRKIILYTAVSLDGLIAGTDGAIDWLLEYPNPNKQDYGYQRFYEKIDTLLMGHATYTQIMGFNIPFPYPGKSVYVFSTQKHPDTPHVNFLSGDAAAAIRTLKNKTGKDIWLVGGGKLNGFVLSNDLIDEMTLHIPAVVLGAGIPLFGGIPATRNFRLVASKSYPNGMLELHYDRGEQE